MTLELNQVINLKVDSANFWYGSYILKTLLIGRELWAYGDSSIKAPDSTSPEFSKL